MTTTIKLPKYRIIEKAGVYRVQRKWCGVWWTTFHTIGAGEYRMLTPYFPSLERASNYIHKLQAERLKNKARWKVAEYQVSMTLPAMAKEFIIPPPTGTSYQPPPKPSPPPLRAIREDKYPRTGAKHP